MKQKHWQVSVFKKTIEIIKDDLFYTTDTEAYLVFELIDEDFKPDSAMVTVYNIYGTAIISVSVEVADGIVRYEIPEKAIRHIGGWRTQAIFTKDGEDYTTAIIEFDVGGHLLDSKKPPIIEIENWNRLIEHAEDLIDDWEQLEEIRQTNEEQRELAESARQTTFETNESTRQSEFETNEASRQTSELVREEAESNRQSEFEENELARESAESVRVANEAERISKDSERDSKIEAVEEELNQHKLDYAGLVTEVNSKANKVQEDWITPTLLNGWYAIRPFEPPQYMKDTLGFVHFRGVISKSDETTSNIAFKLPSTYRPLTNVTDTVVAVGRAGSVPKAVTIYNATGNVDFAGAVSGEWYSISHIFEAGE